MLKLRPYQDAGLAALRASIAAGKRAPLYVLPTGGGKTAVSGSVAAGVAARKKIAWFIVPSLVLLSQTREKFAEYGIRCGVIHSGYTPDASAPVQVITIQTLDRWCAKGLHGDTATARMFFPASGRRPAMWAPDLGVLDEAHHACAAQYLRVTTALADARWLGVTATPQRLDGKGLGKHVGGVFDDMVLGPSMAELIDMGFLTPSTVYAPPAGIDLSGVHTRAGDFAIDEAAERVDRPAITGSVVGHYRRLAEGKRAVAFCCSIAHSQHVAAEFSAAGVPAAHIDGEMEDADLRRVLRDFEAGRILVLTNCSLVSEGFDLPGIEVAILLRPTQSVALYLQQIGRALRPAPGKTSAIILDHVGNVVRHGLPDDDRAWTLDGQRRGGKRDAEASAPPVRQCPMCFASHRPAPTCPACGHTYVAEGRTLEEREGELQAVDKDLFRAQREAERAQRAAEVKGARTREDLERIAAERGYKPGWVEHQLRFRGGNGGGRMSHLDEVIAHQERIYGQRGQRRAAE